MYRYSLREIKNYIKLMQLSGIIIYIQMILKYLQLKRLFVYQTELYYLEDDSEKETDL